MSLRKGVYPYEFMVKYNKMSLSEKEEFYSFNIQDIRDSEYNHVKRIL